ncbi:hypothetical protein Y032_0017g3398 [Ancylostoma ceylanicum]|uniref:SHSP domain-containing protein n=1 Tax=Ancylostoma ceylanicum TaxID=53326 RepID=A0A016V4B5_9BILA|nr:hypothetical protein Y032_0017g3398 [Ancylostoma ceylanicum]
MQLLAYTTKTTNNSCCARVHAHHYLLGQTVNDDKKFAVTIDVSQFRPEELKVNLDGRCLTVEGKQEQKDDRSFMARSFVRSWTLPEDANLEALRTELSDRGQLTIEAPKTGTSGTKKNIPICPAHK